MITKGIEDAVMHSLAEAQLAETGTDLLKRKREILNLIRMEAINLADKIIGKDIMMHNTYDENGEAHLNPQEKAVFDHQVKQRIMLAEYQKPQDGPTGPEDLINPELSEGEQ